MSPVVQSAFQLRYWSKPSRRGSDNAEGWYGRHSCSGGELRVSRTAVRPPEGSNSLLGKTSESSPSRTQGMPNNFFFCRCSKYKDFFIHTCSRPALTRTLVIRIGLTLRINFWRILQNLLTLKLPVTRSSTVQCYDF